jgi:nicotinate-nucleotide adenylyltransferase
VNVGLFGGTFDPPHLGHLVLADQCANALALGEVDFVLAYRPPHKEGLLLTDFGTRRRLLAAATEDDPRFRVVTLEGERQGPSYTVETLRILCAARPGDRFWLLLGEDSLDEISSWREPEEIARLARVAVYQRRGASGAVPEAFRGRVDRVAGPRIEISSTWVRAQLRAGRSVRHLLPSAVAELVRSEGLYRTPEAR